MIEKDTEDTCDVKNNKNYLRFVLSKKSSFLTVFCYNIFKKTSKEKLKFTRILVGWLS